MSDRECHRGRKPSGCAALCFPMQMQMQMPTLEEYGHTEPYLLASLTPLMTPDTVAFGVGLFNSERQRPGGHENKMGKELGASVRKIVDMAEKARASGRRIGDDGDDMAVRKVLPSRIMERFRHQRFELSNSPRECESTFPGDLILSADYCPDVLVTSWTCGRISPNFIGDLQVQEGTDQFDRAMVEHCLFKNLLAWGRR
ncbi:hypothetical protein FB451DRAFT_1174782 [Mycena latifolia]|nr:hypothetical protein FB451DRAFT_1174782 [Mycena latifolia]